MNNLGNLLKQAQKFQSQVSQIQAELGEQRVEVSAGGGMVTAIVNGRQELLGVRIDPQVVDPSDVEMLEDLVVAAVSEAMTRASEMAAERMRKLTGGLELPGIV
ncbi:MAG TPA: YbaB/EbfC family nucleoid-associated protein [Gemmatimonadota bacterium]|nr:YbaB/EbfC family nucleoid-associated protein [Gemmatimonadota bacterium]